LKVILEMPGVEKGNLDIRRVEGGVLFVASRLDLTKAFLRSFCAEARENPVAPVWAPAAMDSTPIPRGPISPCMVLLHSVPTLFPIT